MDFMVQIVDLFYLIVVGVWFRTIVGEPAQLWRVHEGCNGDSVWCAGVAQPSNTQNSLCELLVARVDEVSTVSVLQVGVASD